MKTNRFCQMLLIFIFSAFGQSVFAEKKTQKEPEDKNKIIAFRVTSVEELEALSNNHQHPAQLMTIQITEEMTKDLVQYLYDHSDESFIHHHSKGFLNNAFFYGFLGSLVGVYFGLVNDNRYYNPDFSEIFIHYAMNISAVALAGAGIGSGYYILSKMIQKGIKIADNVVTLPEYLLPQFYEKMKLARDYMKLKEGGENAPVSEKHSGKKKK